MPSSSSLGRLLRARPMPPPYAPPAGSSPPPRKRDQPSINAKSPWQSPQLSTRHPLPGVYSCVAWTNGQPGTDRKAQGRRLVAGQNRRLTSSVQASVEEGQGHGAAPKEGFAHGYGAQRDETGWSAIEGRRQGQIRGELERVNRCQAISRY